MNNVNSLITIENGILKLEGNVCYHTNTALGSRLGSTFETADVMREIGRLATEHGMSMTILASRSVFVHVSDDKGAEPQYSFLEEGGQTVTLGGITRVVRKGDQLRITYANGTQVRQATNEAIFPISGVKCIKFTFPIRNRYVAVDTTTFGTVVTLSKKYRDTKDRNSVDTFDLTASGRNFKVFDTLTGATVARPSWYNSTEADANARLLAQYRRALEMDFPFYPRVDVVRMTSATESVVLLAELNKRGQIEIDTFDKKTLMAVSANHSSNIAYIAPEY